MIVFARAYAARQLGRGPNLGRAQAAAPCEAEWAMTKGRPEAFTDGVIAIIITNMVLELRSRTSSASLRCNPVFQCSSRMF